MSVTKKDGSLGAIKLQTPVRLTDAPLELSAICSPEYRLVPSSVIRKTAASNDSANPAIGHSNAATSSAAHVGAGALSVITPSGEYDFDFAIQESIQTYWREHNSRLPVDIDSVSEIFEGASPEAAAAAALMSLAGTTKKVPSLLQSTGAAKPKSSMQSPNKVFWYVTNITHLLCSYLLLIMRCFFFFFCATGLLRKQKLISIWIKATSRNLLVQNYLLISNRWRPSFDMKSPWESNRLGQIRLPKHVILVLVLLRQFQQLHNHNRCYPNHRAYISISISISILSLFLYIHICIYLYIYLSFLSIFLKYIYIYLFVCVCVCVYIKISMFVFTLDASSEL